MANGAEPVRNDYAGPVLHHIIYCVLYEALTFRIEGRSGFIQNQDGWIFQHRTRNGNPLPFTTAKFGTPVSDIGLVTVFFLADELMSIGYAGGLLNIFQ